jgi:hypothetical protein
MPRLPNGLASRTRRPRPSEKTGLPVISGISPQGLSPRLGLSSEGRAPHARTEKNGLHRGMSPLGHRAFDCPFMITLCLALRTASQCGRGDRAPPRKTPSAFSPGFPRKAFHSGKAPPRRGGLRTPEGKARASPRHVPARQPASGQLVDNDDVPRLAHRIAMRTRRPRPSEKIALRLVSGRFPARPPVLASFPTPALKTP